MKKTIKISTKGKTDIINITYQIQEILDKSDSEEGVINIFVKHTTCGLMITEYEQGILHDLKKEFEKIAPEHESYRHNQLNNEDNAHSHIRSSLLGCSMQIPFKDKKLNLGTWQDIVLIDFDTHPREREITITILPTS